MDNDINMSAPGKIILFGEHSVVYGRTALAFSLNLRTTLNISAYIDSLRIVLPDLEIDHQWSLVVIKELWSRIGETVTNKPSQLSEFQITEIKNFLVPTGYNDNQNNALLAIFHHYFSILKVPIPICLTLSSALPPGGGLGSSAAFSVCISAAFIYLQKKSENEITDLNNILELICNWSLISEKLFHGKPSGIDNAISTYGGAISFKKGDISFIEMPVLQILLINSGVSRSTKDLVDKVKRQHEQQTIEYESVFTEIEDIVEKAISSLNAIKNCSTGESNTHHHFLELSKLVEANQRLLACIEVSHPRLNEIFKITKSHGLIAKLTGAGGGGFAFSIVDGSNKESVVSCQRELKAKGFESWVTQLNGEGVSLLK